LLYGALMARYVTTIPSSLTQEEAFAYMADLRNFAEWDAGVVKVVPKALHKHRNFVEASHDYPAVEQHESQDFPMRELLQRRKRWGVQATSATRIVVMTGF
jgi:hypothetical protein